ncbi:hypothetical protein PCL_03466 [Purpureocillium lilacinum]|uniref:Uncharacterized protein n=1 Tax=Purpureocillium lilacinum TaxID=33203 RepID=A0A2U3EP57_PURLI|nr:hypothetical protein PCL_03466 [Purpureocillium lilacinum]
MAKQPPRVSVPHPAHGRRCYWPNASVPPAKPRTMHMARMQVMQGLAHLSARRGVRGPMAKSARPPAPSSFPLTARATMVAASAILDVRCSGPGPDGMKERDGRVHKPLSIVAPMRFVGTRTPLFEVTRMGRSRSCPSRLPPERHEKDDAWRDPGTGGKVEHSPCGGEGSVHELASLKLPNAAHHCPHRGTVVLVAGRALGQVRSTHGHTKDLRHSSRHPRIDCVRDAAIQRTARPCPFGRVQPTPSSPCPQANTPIFPILPPPFPLRATLTQRKSKGSEFAPTGSQHGIKTFSLRFRLTKASRPGHWKRGLVHRRTSAARHGKKKARPISTHPVLHRSQRPFFVSLRLDQDTPAATRLHSESRRVALQVSNLGVPSGLHHRRGQDEENECARTYGSIHAGTPPAEAKNTECTRTVPFGGVLSAKFVLPLVSGLPTYELKDGSARLRPTLRAARLTRVPVFILPLNAARRHGRWARPRSVGERKGESGQDR